MKHRSVNFYILLIMDNKDNEEDDNKFGSNDWNYVSSDEQSNFSTDNFIYQQKTDTYFQKLVNDMDSSEQQRYETFRRSNFVKGAIKKYINNVIGQAVNPNIVIGISGLAKVFIGELVIEALAVQKEFDHKGALLPIHIHEAMRRIEKRIPNVGLKEKSPWDYGI